jgi:hypothetical protein
LFVDFNKEGLTWKFNDIYSFDRLVPKNSQSPAPEWFKVLSEKISLRDANFYPDFTHSAKNYEHFFTGINEQRPDIILAINLNLITKLLNISGEILLPQWKLRLDSGNFDLMLSFLVEAKLAGRYDVKSPLLNFAQAIFAESKALLDWQKVSQENWHLFWQQKNILAYSHHRKLQDIFKKWKIAGEFSNLNSYDNFLQFDFVSIGANKSEKFVWTKIQHNSELSPSGRVRNSLNIIRNHQGKSGLIQN